MKNAEQIEERLNEIKDDERFDYLLVPTKNIANFIIYGKGESPDGNHEIVFTSTDGMMFLNSRKFTVDGQSLGDTIREQEGKK